jgi:uncharacterized OsmC-like protein
MICNGIDTDRLAAFGGFVAEHPDAATLSTRVATRWEESYRTEAATTAFKLAGEPIPRTTSLSSDLPRALGGDEAGPTPGELVLAALGSCVAQAFVESAAMTGVSIDHLEVAAEGHLDLRGIVGFAGARPGFSRIHLDIQVASSTDAAQIDELVAAALHRSPVADTVRAGVPVDASVRQPDPA